MAVYRPTRKFTIRPAFLVLIVIIIVVVVALLLITRSASAPQDPLAQARSEALQAAEGLDVFTVEYPKVLQGVTSGAGPALERAKQAWAAASPAFKSLDPQGTAQLDADFLTLDLKVSAKAPADEVTALADSIRVRLLNLGKTQP